MYDSKKPLSEPPTFVKKMEPKFTWKQGISARLQCSVKGSPELHIHWFWNEHELNDGEKYKTSLKNGVAILEILNLVVADSGHYSCEVSNNAGSDSCSTLVAVKGLSPGGFILVLQVRWLQCVTTLSIRRASIH